MSGWKVLFAAHTNVTSVTNVTKITDILHTGKTPAAFGRLALPARRTAAGDYNAGELLERRRTSLPEILILWNPRNGLCHHHAVTLGYTDTVTVFCKALLPGGWDNGPASSIIMETDDNTIFHKADCPDTLTLPT